MRKVRKLRHWKQRFNPNARFIWRRPTTFFGTLYEAGTEVPEGLVTGAKLRRFWESQRIELFEFEDPNVATGQREAKDDQLVLPEGVTVTKLNGSWYLVKIVGDEKDYKVNGNKKLAEFIAEVTTERAKAEAQAKADIEDAAAFFKKCDDLGIEVTAEIVADLTDDQFAELELYVESVEAEDEEVERPEFLPTTASDGGEPDPDAIGDDDSPLEGADSDDEADQTDSS